jgi:uncharacterized DUF497 family protein
MGFWQPALDLQYGEARFGIMGMVEGRLLLVVYTERSKPDKNHIGTESDGT